MFNVATKSKLKVKDIDEAKATVEALELQFNKQQKLLKRQQLDFKCEKCHTKIQVSEGKRRPTCPNEKCLARYHVEFVYPGPVETSLDSSLTSDSIKPIEPQLSDEIIIPTIHATFKGYAFESRVNYPSAECSNEQLFSRILTASERLQHVPDLSKESILLDVIELIKRLYKDE